MSKHGDTICLSVKTNGVTMYRHGITHSLRYTKARGAASGFNSIRLSYLLLQSFEQFRIEELPQRYLQSVAKLID